jgi:uncharacterized membrane protein YgdD (TMEM256/DUF423 family)
MNNRLALKIAALTGAVAVGLGAFGAHALKDLLTKSHTEEIWRTAVFYHLIHAVMIYLLSTRNRLHTGPWVCFFVGILIFSGSLYLLCVTGMRWLGAITPIGGVSFIAGWIWLVCDRELKDR